MPKLIFNIITLVPSLFIALLLFSDIVVGQNWFSTYTDNCREVVGFNGTIEDVRGRSHYSSNINFYTSCWKLLVQRNEFVRLKLLKISFDSEDCDQNYLKISTKKEDEDYKFCRNDVAPIAITSFNDVEVYFHLNRHHPGSFTLEYEIQDIQCSREGSFHCTSFSCIPMSQVCNDIRDCRNGADEIGCATGVNSVEGVANANRIAIDRLRKMRTPMKGWKKNTVRAITALYLSEKPKFNGQNMEEELRAKQIELETAVMMLKSPMSSQTLSMHINALLLTCQDPRNFYGRDLVKILKDASGNFTHPSAYLALCNAKEEWPKRATSDLLNILNSDSEYSFIGDFQAFAVMAVSCYNASNYLNRTENANLLSQYLESIKSFKEKQLPDGSFGNVHATGLITQSLLSSGQEHVKDWKLNATLKYLMKELNDSRADFLTYYLTLPILNGKSLSDIAKVNCSMSSIRTGSQLESEIQHNVGPKIRIQYSLFVGDEKDIIHTLHLKIPESFTAFEIMQFAQEKDTKYKLQWKKVDNKIDVYDITQIANDPELGKFWLVFYGKEGDDVFTHSHKSVDQLKLEDNSHLVLWYKSVEV